MIRLHINIDHVATIRNARGTVYPDPVVAAALCELAGADGITAHLREDRRHIKDDDIARLRAALTTQLNLEMAATDEMRSIAERTLPDAVTLVPERRAELTTEGGLDVVVARFAIEKVAVMCTQRKIKLSLFIAPDEAHVRLSRELGAAQVEFHTGEYCLKKGDERGRELDRLKRACTLAHELGLEVAAGHGLTRANVVEVAAIPELVELNIGHSVIADAVLIGMDQAVRDLRSALQRGIAERRLGS